MLIFGAGGDRIVGVDAAVQLHQAHLDAKRSKVSEGASVSTARLAVIQGASHVSCFCFEQWLVEIANFMREHR